MQPAGPQAPPGLHVQVDGDRRGSTHNKTLAMTWALASPPRGGADLARATQTVLPRPGRWQ
ncbi:hypothetical protein ES705_24284 [subsurface metagenome]